MDFFCGIYLFLREEGKVNFLLFLLYFISHSGAVQKNYILSEAKWGKGDKPCPLGVEKNAWNFRKSLFSKANICIHEMNT